MKKVTMYEAFDGEKFDTEEECLEYERKYFPSQEGLDGLLMLDSKTIFIMKDPEKSYYDYYNELKWFVVTEATDEAFACIKNILDSGPYIYPDPIIEGHIYTWDTDNGWYDFSEKFCQLKEDADIILNAIDFGKQLKAQIKQNEETT